ncbi:Asparagine synthase, glutamine-hydrolyzing [Lentisphaera araneosa HTCC2155]|uniref:asparagine synthase (glutamine-hydrolyzing) n=1 Tax=Lentisphaera araneosa HTCC2155 TaxID=313628 RepID=A6DRP1_9BACT|nr:asparagine synthase-related protein [Lentisphaera araneosa]EDM25710.1 Asparagine synthase, glutamine-hydrolyzing [Lentisphaera araneosa HTCC2155]
MLSHSQLDIQGDIHIYSHSSLAEQAEEYVLSLFTQTENNFVNKLYGDFSFLIHDQTKNEYFGARDHLGVIPFFYCFQNDKIFYSTKLKDLVHNPEITPQINDDWVIRYLNDWEEEEHETAYSNIFRLPPAHSLHYKNGNLKISRYWQMTKPETINISREEACRLFREKLTYAVKQRLPVDDTPLASELTGGVDSTTITALASKIDSAIHSFTHAAEHGNDERYLVNDFLEMHPEIKHKLITKKNVNIADDCRWATTHLAQPPRAGVGEWARQLMQAASESGSKIIFSGFGGDEGVSQRASGCAYAEFIKNHQWGHIYIEAKNRRPILWPYTFSHIIYKYFFKSKPLFFDNSFDQNFLKPEFRLPPQKQNHGLPRKSTFEYTKYLLPDRRHTAQRLEESYQLGAEFGLQYRYPLLDIKLIDFFNSLPTHCKVYLNQNRYLFRNESMSDLTPKTIRYNYDKSIGGSIVPGLDEVWTTLNSELDQVFDLPHINQHYIKQAHQEKHPTIPIYLLIACKELYRK